MCIFSLKIFIVSIGRKDTGQGRIKQHMQKCQQWIRKYKHRSFRTRMSLAVNCYQQQTYTDSKSPLNIFLHLGSWTSPLNLGSNFKKLESVGCESMERPQDATALKKDLFGWWLSRTFPLSHPTESCSSKIKTLVMHSVSVNETLNSPFDIFDLWKMLSLRSPHVFHVLHSSYCLTEKQHLQFQELKLITTSERNPT